MGSQVTEFRGDPLWSLEGREGGREGPTGLGFQGTAVEVSHQVGTEEGSGKVCQGPLEPALGEQWLPGRRLRNGSTTCPDRSSEAGRTALEYVPDLAMLGPGLEGQAGGIPDRTGMRSLAWQGMVASWCELRDLHPHLTGPLAGAWRSLSTAQVPSPSDKALALEASVLPPNTHFLP